jgi:hypothetical protein
MTEIALEQFEPVYLIPEGPARPTEYGKRWLERCFDLIDRFLTPAVLKDIAAVARIEAAEWDPRMNALASAGIPMAANGISQAIMQKILDYCDGLTTTAFSPAAGPYLAISTTSPTSTTTGITMADGTSNYTGYARFLLTPATYLNAATAATPAVSTSKATISMAACSGGSAVTENGFMIADAATTNTGNSYFFGSMTAVTISPTQTPPTIASGALSLSLTSS